MSQPDLYIGITNPQPRYDIGDIVDRQGLSFLVTSIYFNGLGNHFYRLYCLSTMQTYERLVEALDDPNRIVF